jgi:hypothetical protein
MTALTDLWRAACRRLVLAWWRWAAREIDPLHPDVPRVVLRIAELQR